MYDGFVEEEIPRNGKKLELLLDERSLSCLVKEVACLRQQSILEEDWIKFSFCAD